MDNKRITITILFALSLLGAYSIYQPFLLPIVVATLLAMATYNLTKKLITYFHSRKISAMITSLFLVLILVAPLVYMATAGVAYISKLDANIVAQGTSGLEAFVEKIPYLKEWSQTALNEEKITGYIQYATSYLTTAGSAGLGFVKNMFLVVIFYFIINFYGERFFDAIRVLMPVSKIRSAKMIHEVSSTMEVVFYSIIVTAIFEGFLFGIMAGYFGFNGLFFGIIYGFASLIPIVGGMLIWLPLALFTWGKMDAQSALFIAGYSVLMIAVIADTIIKPIIIRVIKENLLKSTMEINEFVIFFSILAGMSTYGFWGMILGPAITSFLIAMTKVYIDYNNKEQAIKPT